MNRGLILDLDNTLYSWVDAFVPSFRATVHKLAALLRINEESIYDSFKDVYNYYGTIEYPNAIEELSLWHEYKIDQVVRMKYVNEVKKVASIVFRKNLVLYPGVFEVLQCASMDGVTIIGLTDSLEYWACYRLRKLRIEKFFTALYTWNNIEWFKSRKGPRSAIYKRVGLFDDQLKPNVKIILQILADMYLDRSCTYMVGDSLSKDIKPAQEAEINDVWAHYGTQFKEKNLVTLRYITPWSESQKLADNMAKQYVRPTRVINSFYEMLDVMELHNRTLF